MKIAGAVVGVVFVFVGMWAFSTWLIMILWGAVVGMMEADFFTPSFWQAAIIGFVLMMLKSGWSVTRSK